MIGPNCTFQSFREGWTCGALDPGADLGDASRLSGACPRPLEHQRKVSYGRVQNGFCQNAAALSSLRGGHSSGYAPGLWLCLSGGHLVGPPQTRGIAASPNHTELPAPVALWMPLGVVTPAGQPCRTRFLGEGPPPPPARRTARSLHCPVLVILTEFVFWWLPREGVCQPDERLSGCAEGPT